MDFNVATYIAQTWGLLYLVVLFLCMLVYALKPSSREKFNKAAQIPFRED